MPRFKPEDMNLVPTGALIPRQWESLSTRIDGVITHHLSTARDACAVLSDRTTRRGSHTKPSYLLAQKEIEKEARVSLSNAWRALEMLMAEIASADHQASIMEKPTHE